MRLCYLSNSTLISDSANAVHVMKMCQAFADNGHDVTLHALEGEGEVDEVFNYYGVTTTFPIHRHNMGNDGATNALWKLRALLPFLRVGGLPTVVFARRQLAPIISRTPSDLIYARSLYWLYGVRTAIPFIYESHQPPLNALDRYVERAIFNRPGFRGLTVISQKLKQIYVAQYPGLADRIRVAHDAADDPGDAPDAEGTNHTDAGKIRVGYVGHLYKGRGIDLMLRLAESFPVTEFHFVGGRTIDVERF